MSPDDYCQQNAAQSGSSFYYSFLFLPPDRRRAITAQYAFCREVDDTVDECTDTGVARARLDWRRKEIGDMLAGHPSHPVTQAMQPKQTTNTQDNAQQHTNNDSKQKDQNQNRNQNKPRKQRKSRHVAS